MSTKSRSSVGSLGFSENLRTHTGDTDPLADALAEAHEAWEEDTYASLSQVLADAIRAALADGSLPLRAVLPPEVADVLDAAVAFCGPFEDARPWHSLFASVDALPEHLRGQS